MELLSEKTLVFATAKISLTIASHLFLTSTVRDLPFGSKVSRISSGGGTNLYFICWRYVALFVLVHWESVKQLRALLEHLHTQYASRSTKFIFINVFYNYQAMKEGECSDIHLFLT